MSSTPGNESAASKLANTAGEAAANSGKRWLAILGAGALIVSGSVFAYNSLHKEEEAFTADGGEEFAQVCQDAKTGRRVEDSECEKAGEAANSSDSSSSSNSNARGQRKRLGILLQIPALVLRAILIPELRIPVIRARHTIPVQPTRSCGTTLAVRLAGTGAFPQ